MRLTVAAAADDSLHRDSGLPETKSQL